VSSVPLGLSGGGEAANEDERAHKEDKGPDSDGCRRVDLGEAECNGHHPENEDIQLQSTSAGNLDEPGRSEIPKVASDPWREPELPDNEPPTEKPLDQCERLEASSYFGLAERTVR
jgi:hypothetical protein